MAAASTAPGRRRASAALGRAPGIRWDRLGRIGLLAVLGMIVLLYVAPARHWLAQSRTAGRQAQDLRDTQAENRRLERRMRALRNPDTLEMEARRMGMVKVGERSYVIENPPR